MDLFQLFGFAGDPRGKFDPADAGGGSGTYIQVEETELKFIAEFPIKAGIHSENCGTFPRREPFFKNRAVRKDTCFAVIQQLQHREDRI